MVYQCGIIFGFLAIGELIVWLTGIKLPSSIIGMLLLTACLQLKWIRLRWVEGIANFLVKNLGFFFIPPGVALAVPLYKQLSTVKKQLLPITLSALGGCISGIISVVWVADVCGASHDVVMSLASKSVTTPIAMEVASSLGGIPSLTAAVVVSVGIFGGIVGFGVMRWSRVHSPIAQGLSMGTAAHAVGSSRAFGISDRYGAFASLGLTLNGIFTAILTPSILHIVGYF